jgi:hypothetical protein
MSPDLGAVSTVAIVNRNNHNNCMFMHRGSAT